MPSLNSLLLRHRSRATLMATFLALGLTQWACACDRSCLTELADQTLASMVNHAPQALPLATRYRATENAVPAAPVMMTAWRTFTALRDRFLVIDAHTQQVFLIAGMAEGPNDTLLWGRIKVEQRQIVELELYQNRSRAQGGYQFAGNGPAHFPAAWTAAVEPSRLSPRGTLQAHARAIFAGRGRTLPPAADCVLMENGKVVEEHAEIAAEVAGLASDRRSGLVAIPCGVPPQRPTDRLARTTLIDEVQGIVVTQAIVHGSTQPMILTQPAESAFVPDQILAPYAAMLRKQQAQGAKVGAQLTPIKASASVAEVHRLYDGHLQGQLLLVNIGAPGGMSPWVH